MGVSRSVCVAAFAVFAGCMDTGTSAPTYEERQAERLIVAGQRIADCSATECGRLDLDSSGVTDFAQVANLTHVTAFMASYTDFADLGDLAGMAGLRELHLGSTMVADLSGLRAFPNLQLLHLQDSANVTDFSPIGAMTNLRELAVGRNDLGDLGFLRGLRRLTALDLERATITDINVLRNHPTLERIDLFGTDLPEDISALLTIRTLKEAAIDDSNLTDAQAAVIAQLRARGVLIPVVEVVAVC